MKKLFWSHDPVMSSVYASESWVQHLRDTVGTALERAVAPAAEYIETLEPFVEFLNVDGEPLVHGNAGICLRQTYSGAVVVDLLWLPGITFVVSPTHNKIVEPQSGSVWFIIRTPYLI